MKNKLIIMLLFMGTFLSCSNKEKNEIIIIEGEKYISIAESNIEGSEKIHRNQLDAKGDKILSVFIEYNPEYKIPGENDDNMLSNVNIVYKAESGFILNIEEIENKIVNDILEKPVLNKNISLISTYAQNPYFNGIFNLLEYINVQLFDEDIEKINELENYKTFKIEVENMNVYIFSVFENIYKLFMLEYYIDNAYYQYSIELGIGKNEIIEMLGIPAYYSVEDNIYIYESFSTLRRIVIFFENDKTVKVQLISFDGI